MGGAVNRDYALRLLGDRRQVDAQVAVVALHDVARQIGERHGVEVETRAVLLRVVELGADTVRIQALLRAHFFERPNAVAAVVDPVALEHVRPHRGLAWARESGLETQINTTVTAHNRSRLSRIAALVAESEAKLWSVFFLVATGRASREDDLTAEEYEQVFAYLYELAKTAPFDIKTTEAQHYRRFVAQQRKIDRSAGASPRSDVITRHGGINDGKGLVFISHTGEIYPSGFLPLSAGNVRRDSLAEVYRDHPLFLGLRNPDGFSGKCGVCEYRKLCGGSRSRAYALEGDCFASDPRCNYRPMAHEPPAAAMQESRV